MSYGSSILSIIFFKGIEFSDSTECLFEKNLFKK